VANKITYYAVVTGGTVHRAQGLLRRLEHDDGPEDEALHTDMGWRWTSMLVEHEHGCSDEDLVEVSHAQARKIVQHLRKRNAGLT
jgi:hypothetical protein